MVAETRTGRRLETGTGIYLSSMKAVLFEMQVHSIQLTGAGWLPRQRCHHGYPEKPGCSSLWTAHTQHKVGQFELEPAAEVHNSFLLPADFPVSMQTGGRIRFLVDNRIPVAAQGEFTRSTEDVSEIASCCPSQARTDFGRDKSSGPGAQTRAARRLIADCNLY
ncbi:hypothetical protein Baya_14896 [Bagarius yarrelli]|uniref:Uncharacterized protein n=1 Tax=Bagarius yarrelli TaxID=175774 RepID=A0A556VA71_BAGYA|nr:hypothetical protein Baya_14896 [Bagarius yarrelli]